MLIATISGEMTVDFGKIAIRWNGLLMKWSFGEMISAKWTSVKRILAKQTIWRNGFGETSLWWNVPSVKCPFSKMYIWQNGFGEMGFNEMAFSEMYCNRYNWPFKFQILQLLTLLNWKWSANNRLNFQPTLQSQLLISNT
jgi:hypothetical protein